MEKLPSIVLTQILEKLPRRELEDSIIFVCSKFQDAVLDILSGRVFILLISTVNGRDTVRKREKKKKGE